MLRFFRSSNTIVIVVILLLGGLTWLHALLRSGMQVESRYGAFLFDLLYSLLESIPRLFAWSGLIFTLSAAIVLISVNNKLHLIDKISYLPALCYVLLIGGVPVIHRFNPELLAVILLMLAFIQLIKSFASDRLSYAYFSAPVFIALSTFFYQHMYVYMLIVWFSILFLRPGYWREWVFSVLGFLLPYFFAFSWYFLVEDDSTRIFVFLQEVFSIQRVIPGLSTSTIAFFSISILVVILIFRHLLRYIGSKKIIIRNGYYILIAIAVVTAALSAVIPDTLPWTWYLMAFPLSFFLSNYLTTVKSLRWGNIILASLFAGVLIAQVIYLYQL